VPLVNERRDGRQAGLLVGDAGFRSFFNLRQSGVGSWRHRRRAA
jgi:hypothetical protein